MQLEGSTSMIEVGRYNDIHPSARVAESARVCGWCYIGPGAVIGENAVVGNFCEINSGAVVGDGTLLNSHCVLNSDTVVGSGCIFGSHVLTADEKYMTARTSNITKRPCRIGDDCRIGQGSALVSAELGDHVSIGALSLVLEPKIPPRQVWVGSPARFLRMMTDEEMAI